MRGLGTLVNVVTILAGTALGLVAGSRLGETVRTTVLAGIGLATLGVGTASFLETGNAAFPVVAVVIGGLLGEVTGIEDRLAGLGDRLRRLGSRGGDVGERSTFVEGFVLATLTFCVGALAIVGSLQDGIRGDSELLLVKSALDGVVAVVFAAAYGIGVGFAALSVLVVQGTLTVLGAIAGEALLSGRMVEELEATGGLLIIGIGLRLLQIKDLRVGSFLPALVLAPVLVAVFSGS
ncbi:MAG TPA: DUF554 domain-containing protein [Acidimicrobiales bacterium]|nr:DUF554 domain-containing protein [Acidimicrobiales bacterium]